MLSHPDFRSLAWAESNSRPKPTEGCFSIALGMDEPGSQRPFHIPMPNNGFSRRDLQP